MSSLFPIILVAVTFLSAIVWLIDYSFFAVEREVSGKKVPWYFDYARSFLPVLIIVLVIRSFIFQLYTVPTGSLMPTVVPGDLIFVEQYAYGLRLPIIHRKVLSIGEPKRGDIAVFRYPVNPSVNYIKRIVGVPGDHIVYKNRILYINGKEARQKVIGSMQYNTHQSDDYVFPAKILEEDLAGIKHKILINTKQSEDGQKVFDFVVPKGFYFAMGDNRDDSADSRVWGFVPAANLVGRAYRVIFSWNSQTHRPRWSRIWNKLHD